MARRLGITVFNTLSRNFSSVSLKSIRNPKIIFNPLFESRINCPNIRPFSAFSSPCFNKANEIKNLADRLLTIKIDESQDKKGDKKEFNKKTQQYVIFISCGIIGTLGLAFIYTMGSPDCDENGIPIKDEFSDLNIFKSYILRTNKEVRDFCQFFQNPSRDKLLPDHPENIYKPPFTLVLEMRSILVHPDWTYNTGWRFKKRPFLDYFLNQISFPTFEVVVYTAEQGFTAFPVLEKLDPNNCIIYKLYRDTTRYINGHHVKDLSCLNRDLSKVIILDWDEKSFQLQPRNALKLKKWDGNDDDKQLIDLANFLRMLSESGIEDVRTVLDYYRQFDDPLKAFKENQQKLAEALEKKEKNAIGGKMFQQAKIFNEIPFKK